MESVAEGPDAERVIRQLAADGNQLIFTTSFGYMNPTIKVAKQFPKVTFAHSSGYKRATNVSTYLARFYEGRYLAGIIAGKMTKSQYAWLRGRVSDPRGRSWYQRICPWRAQRKPGCPGARCLGLQLVRPRQGT